MDINLNHTSIPIAERKNVKESIMQQEPKNYTRISDLGFLERGDFIERYTQLEDYYSDSVYPNLHIIKKEKPTLEKEIRLARRIACFGYEVFILPEKLKDRFGAVYASFKPDTITEGLFLELKEMDKNDHKDNARAVQNIFRKARKQGDVVYVHIPFEYTKNEVVSAINRQLKGLKENNKSYLGKGLIVSTDTENDLTFYEVKKNGTLSEGVPFGSPTLAKFNQIRTDSSITPSNSSVNESTDGS